MTASKWGCCILLQKAGDTRRSPSRQMTPTGVSKKVAPPKTFGNIFTSVESFLREVLKTCWHFISTRISTNFCRFILIFNQMALIFPRVPIIFSLSLQVLTLEYSTRKWICSNGVIFSCRPIGKLSYNDKLCILLHREQGFGAKAIISSYPDKG